MSTKTIEKKTTLKPIANPLNIQELGKVLAKHYELTEEKYDVVIEFTIGMGAIGPTPETKVPGAMVWRSSNWAHCNGDCNTAYDRSI